MRKLKFYMIGLIPGLLIVFFILNKKGASCSYFPNDRVIAETLTKKFTFSTDFEKGMSDFNINEKFIKDSVVSKGEIDFNRSHAQAEPCPDYLLKYPAKNPRFEVIFSKCKEEAHFNSIKKIK